MHPRLAALSIALLAASLLAGCLGGDALEAPPRAAVTVTELDEDTYRFDASASTGAGLRFEWSLGDGTTAAEAVVEHRYAHGSGAYEALLFITDPHGRQAFWNDTIVIGDGRNDPPQARFTLPKRIFTVEEAVQVDAGSSHDRENDPLEYRWDFNHLMSLREYETFRAKKAAAGSGTDADEKHALALGVLDGLLGGKHGGDDHGAGSEITPSLFTHTATTAEPVYTLESGFPEETTFFIRLQVYDIKGAHERILSEEIWPVEIDNDPPPRVASGSEEGRFDFGVDSQTAALLPTGEPFDEVYRFEHATDFVIDLPPERVFVNVTFNLGDLHELDGNVPANEMLLQVTPPSGNNVSAQERDGTLLLAWTDLDEPGEGKWELYLAARFGADIQWELTWWAQVDVNPFRELEAPYLN